MFVLVYGSDGTGKSVQCKSIAESADNSEIWSFARKNRKLYENSEVKYCDLLVMNDDATVNPYRTIDLFTAAVKNTIGSQTKLIVIDDIRLLREWAVPVVIERINKRLRAKGENYTITKITGKNKGAWADVNTLVYGNLEHLASWAEMNDMVVVAISSIKEKYRDVVNSEGEVESVGTGELVVNFSRQPKYFVDVQVRLEKDGSHGKGYYAVFEKTQDWMQAGKPAVKVDKDGLLMELMARGVLS